MFPPKALFRRRRARAHPNLAARFLNRAVKYGLDVQFAARNHWIFRGFPVLLHRDPEPDRQTSHQIEPRDQGIGGEDMKPSQSANPAISNAIAAIKTHFKRCGRACTATVGGSKATGSGWTR